MKINKEKFDNYKINNLNEDGLFPCSKIELYNKSSSIIPQMRLKDEPEINVYSSHDSLLVVNYLINNPSLWEAASIDVIGVQTISGSAPMYGVSFEKAINLALKNGEAISKFFVPESHQRGRFTTLLTKIKQKNGEQKSLQLEAFQVAALSSKVNYLHALSNDFSETFQHLDGKLMEFSENEIDRIFNYGERIKPLCFKKVFRIDGDIEIKHFYGLSRAFLSSSDLYDEYFCHELIQ